MTRSRGSCQGVVKRWRPALVLRPRLDTRVRTRPPSVLTRTRLPASGPCVGTATCMAAASAASRSRRLAVAVASATRTREA